MKTKGRRISPISIKIHLHLFQILPMNKYILSLIIAVLSLTAANAQLKNSSHPRGVCGTIDHTQIFERLERNKKNASEIARSVETIYLPIKFHRVGETNGSQKILPSSILGMLCRLKDELAEADIVPYIYEGFGEIDNSGIFYDPISSANQIVSEKDPNAVNVFITENADTGSGGGGTTLGFYSPSGDYVIVRKKEIVDASGTLAHELGHYLSLPHTFFGWEGTNYSEVDHGNPLEITQVNGRPIELVDRDENCEVAADRLCDTPPDYNFPFSATDIDGDPLNNLATPCGMNVDIFDNQGNLVEPMANNVMSYFDGCQNYVFTEGQIELMVADFMSPERTEINTGYVPNVEEVEGPIVSETPDVEFYNSILFEWEAVENADAYALEITNASGVFTYITDTNQKLVTDLEPDEFYFYSISAYNETSSCVTSSAKPLQTNGEFTSVETLEDIAEIHVYPNPINAGDELIIDINSTESFDADIQLISLNGKIVSTPNNQNIQTNSNTIKVSTSEISSGMYLLQIKSAEGVYSKQIIVK